MTCKEPRLGTKLISKLQDRYITSWSAEHDTVSSPACYLPQCRFPIHLWTLLTFWRLHRLRYLPAEAGEEQYALLQSWLTLLACQEDCMTKTLYCWPSMRLTGQACIPKNTIAAACCSAVCASAGADAILFCSERIVYTIFFIEFE